MERIIIKEVDNTSNIEALSSYDVAYVPGFASNTDALDSLFRTPTLYTDKYAFKAAIAGTSGAPKFAAEQIYPVATPGGAKGFPSYALPEGTSAEYFVIEGLTNIPKRDGAEESSIITEGGIYNLMDTDDTLDSDGHYYCVDSTASSASAFVIKLLPEESGGGYKATAGDYDFNVYTCISPADGWYTIAEGTTNVYEKATKTYIEAEYIGAAPSKNYYSVTVNTPWFAADEIDIGYRYAMYLLSLGIPVYYEVMNNVLGDVSSEDEYGINVTSMYDGLIARFGTGSPQEDESRDSSFDSVGDYSVKYITSGGYPTFEYGNASEINFINDDASLPVVDSPLALAMIQMAEKRGDAIALIDHTNNPNRPLSPSELTSVVARVRSGLDMSLNTSSYGTMFTPWYACSHPAITGDSVDAAKDTTMPASVAYLASLASQIKSYNPWLAVSGVTRGKVPNCTGLHTNESLTNNIADAYQAMPYDIAYPTGGTISINPITYIRNYGYCIWGNRTLRNNRGGTTATSFLNIRNLVADIKKVLYEASQSLMFEQNSDVLWINFKSKVTPILDKMVSNYILSDYGIIKYNVDPETGEPVPAYKLLSAIRIMPINSVEVFDLTVYLENNEIEVAEQE